MWRIPHSSRTAYWCLIVVKEGGPSARSAHAGLSAYKWSSRAALRQQLASGINTSQDASAMPSPTKETTPLLRACASFGAEDGAF
jgi:hypothetical protein